MTKQQKALLDDWLKTDGLELEQCISTMPDLPATGA
jgi:hypothetical protein